MHIKRKPSQILSWDNVIYREQKSLKEEKVESTAKARTQQAGKLWKEDAWRRIRKSVAKVFSCKPKRGGKHVPYASLTRLDQLRISEDELKKSQKKLRFCLKRTEQERDTFGYERCEDSDDEDCDDSVFVQRSESFERRRMAICTEIERNIQVGCRSRSTSLLELRKTLVINNRFKEMGL
ncbi:hypothetical protein ACROYT_G008473 [Oculina patagonica]